MNDITSLLNLPNLLFLTANVKFISLTYKPKYMINIKRKLHSITVKTTVKTKLTTETVKIIYFN